MLRLQLRRMRMTGGKTLRLQRIASVWVQRVVRLVMVMWLVRVVRLFARARTRSLAGRKRETGRGRKRENAAIKINFISA